jgi:hypothetical protein
MGLLRVVDRGGYPAVCHGIPSRLRHVPTCYSQNDARNGGQKRGAPYSATAPQEFRLSFFASLQKKHRNSEEPPFDRSEHVVTLAVVGTEQVRASRAQYLSVARQKRAPLSVALAR